MLHAHLKAHNEKKGKGKKGAGEAAKPGGKGKRKGQEDCGKEVQGNGVSAPAAAASAAARAVAADPAAPVPDFYCVVCELQCPHELQYKEHCEGKKHRRRVQEKEAAAKELAERGHSTALSTEDILDGAPDFQGWLLKSRRQEGERAEDEPTSACTAAAATAANAPGMPVFDRRWFELRGTFLVYRLSNEEGQPSKGIVNLQNVTVARWQPTLDAGEASPSRDDASAGAEDFERLTETSSAPPTPMGMTPLGRPIGQSPCGGPAAGRPPLWASHISPLTPAPPGAVGGDAFRNLHTDPHAAAGRGFSPAATAAAPSPPRPLQPSGSAHSLPVQHPGSAHSLPAAQKGMPPSLSLGDGHAAARLYRLQSQRSGVLLHTPGTGRPEYWGLVLSGGGLSRVITLCMESELELESWERKIEDAVRRAEEADREAELAEFAEDVAEGRCFFERDADGSPLPPRSRKDHSPNSPAAAVRRPTLMDFELLTVVGRGSFGKVLKVQRRGDDRMYAMKVIAKQAVLKDKIADKVRSERQSLAATDHPFVAGLHYAFQSESKLFLVMSFYPGGDLRFHLRCRQRFREDGVAFYGAQMVLALAYLHGRKILYRDLKPANIVLGSDGYAVLTDFGMAKRVRSMRANSFCGTDVYMAPEVVREQEYCEAVDWWSLGIVLYELAVGKPPFWHDCPTDLYDLITDTDVRYPGTLTPELLSLLKELLHKNPDERLTDPIAMLRRPFFSGIDPQMLLDRKLRPPIIPNMSKGDTRYFDAKYTRERPQITKCRPLPKKQDEAFHGFSFPRLSVS
eukprot:TRINITY_DN7848_c0_g1_i1.p1 TRINITY_DN7848_c0_g1~~TRINITY_DN7848_c0_g1_i1.p1  ORF type:complete len:796 (+),score=160.24 TRINITY_DN7848_c0_g1_i1:138-2525(+)